MIIRMIALAAVIVISLGHLPAVAQDSTANQWIKYPNSIGAAGGFTTGYGLSYRRWASNGVGVQATVFPYYLGSKENTTERYSMGLTVLKRISTTSHVNFFAYTSLHYNYYNYTDKNTDTWFDTDNSETRSMKAFGAGPGMDFTTAVDRFLISTMIGVAYYSFSTGETMINLTGEIAAYYSF